MHFRKFIPGILFVALTLCATTALHAEEEKSLWQKFVDWFKPAPTLVGEGPLYDELRELDSKIDRVEGRYSRERRPGNKTRLKKEIEDLRTKRDKLVERIREEEKAKKNQPLVAKPASSATAPASSNPRRGKGQEEPAASRQTRKQRNSTCKFRERIPGKQRCNSRFRDNSCGSMLARHRIRARYCSRPRHALRDCRRQARRKCSPCSNE